MNKRGFGDPEIVQVLSEQRNYARLLCAMYNDMILDKAKKKQEKVVQNAFLQVA